MKRVLVMLAAASLAVAAEARHVRAAVTLETGWNGIYLEATPDEPDPAKFFAGAGVVSVGCYLPDAYEPSSQFRSDGKKILQKPVSYAVWRADDPDSVLQGLVGGCAYVVYSTNTSPVALTYTGVPCAAHMVWRNTVSGERPVLNLCGATLREGAAGVTAAQYFGEGPFGNGTAYYIYGANPNAMESPLPLSALPASLRALAPGRAYALTGAAAASWGGVIDFPSGDALEIPLSSNQAILRFRNAGKAKRAFRLTAVRSALSEERFPALLRALPRTSLDAELAYADVEPGAGWEVEVEADAVAEVALAVDRTKMDASVTSAAVIAIEDLGGSEMRARVPLTVSWEDESKAVARLTASAPTAAAAPSAPTDEDDELAADDFRAGLWGGVLQLDSVSQLDKPGEVVAAAGQMRVNILLFAQKDGTSPVLLQRIATGTDSNGTVRLYKDLDKVPAGSVGRRLSTVMMSVENPQVQATAKSVLGDMADFTWTVSKDARDNPFRHAWHPDHDGLLPDFKTKAPDGDVLKNYENPVKPELWSVWNRLVLTWDGEAGFDPDGVVGGTAVWTVGGLSATDLGGNLISSNIVSKGVFALKRLVRAARIEK